MPFEEIAHIAAKMAAVETTRYLHSTALNAQAVLLEVMDDESRLS